MANVFKIIIRHETFEQSPYNRSTLIKTYENSIVCNVEERVDSCIRFINYVKSNDAYIGVKLSCDCGHGYGFSNGWQEVTLMTNEVFHFVHEGTCVDDDGCPEDFSINYYIGIIPYDEG